MPWEIEQGAVATRLTLTGQVDIFEAAPLHQALLDLTRRSADVHVDLSSCQDLDGSALQLLLAFRRASAGRVALTGAAGRVGRLLAWFGLDEPRPGRRQA